MIHYQIPVKLEVRYASEDISDNYILTAYYEDDVFVVDIERKGGVTHSGHWGWSYRGPECLGVEEALKLIFEPKFANLYHGKITSGGNVLWKKD